MIFDEKCAAHRFTKRSRRLLHHMGERAGDRKLYASDTGSLAALLLWSIVRWERRVGVMALEAICGDLAHLSKEVDCLLNRRADENPAGIRNDVLIHIPSGKPVFCDWNAGLVPLLRAAEASAHHMGNKWVKEEHLLIASIVAADADLAHLLAIHGLTKERVEGAIADIYEAARQRGDG